MLQCEVEFGKPSIRNGSLGKQEVAGIIGFGGDVSGAIVLALPIDVAEQLVERFAGERFPADSEDFPDAIGEITNMIAGGAKANLKRSQISISCPTVIMGENQQVFGPRDRSRVSLGFTTEFGKGAIEVCLREEEQEERGASGSEEPATSKVAG